MIPIKPRLEAAKLEKAAFMLKSLAHPTRMAIIDLLDQYESLTVSEIHEALDCEQSLISHHLNNMRLKGILKTERQGKQINYSMVDKSITSIIDCISNCKTS